MGDLPMAEWRAFQLGDARCKYIGRHLINGKPMDVIAIPAIVLPTTGEPLDVLYQPGTWEHRIQFK